MITYNEIQEQIEEYFELYIKDLFSISGESRKYYYWSVNYFKKVGGLSFQHYELNSNQKYRINQIGKIYFESKNVILEISDTHRNDISIKYYFDLFITPKDKKGQSFRYDYIKEYCLWQILEKDKEQLSINIENLKTKLIEEIAFLSKQEQNEIENQIQSKNNEIEYLSEIIKRQRNNFLIIYISYLCNEHKKPYHKILKDDYTSYLPTNQGQELTKKLELLEQNDGYKNIKLKKRIEKLYVLKGVESKIHFIFSRDGGGEKEELRELLEIMGKKKTGKLYRGQADSSWVLDASITREPKFENAEGEMYYEVLSLKPDAFQNDKTVYERLITMQHYGMPTRLLDITRNPLVAIFFACNNWDAKDSDGTIYTFEQPKKKSDFLNFEDKRLDYLPHLFNHISLVKNQKDAEEFLSQISFIRGVAKNQRINNQSGDFIFVGNGDKVKQELHDLPKMSIIIDSQTKKVLMEQLESLNIHGGAVYPDLTNLSTYIRYKYENKPVSSSSEMLIEFKQEKTKTTTNKKPTKVIKKQVPIKIFDFKSIKSKNRASQITTFAKYYYLDENGLSKLIEDFLFTERKPFRDEVADIMNDKTSVIKEKAKIDTILKEIITLAKLVGEKKE
jgi:hypothetical protein